ncbi:lactate dehydrogenase [Thiospirochaeta perfilievii]|uniref:Lactate dehydrogenase n=1 Tax=Thiospirochaeta perfilievii TaxID=252967 RepID=A0A5C1Q866_9SPIO|nr:D-isomer specific 2-hydroxyacid dehydrogenase family protein [Thiospirochaeta perfilievii]QEN03671.1 lactate dehydrogenase [Thiospirochaeta perfilievii]
MKIIAYAARKDEQYGFDKVSAELQVELKYVTDGLNLGNTEEAAGYEYVTILGHCDASREVLKKLSSLGVKYISSRSAGYNNIDIEAAKEYGIRVSSASYSPNCVADFTLMLMLMCIRNAKQSLLRGEAKDFSLRGLRGLEMKNLVVGVIGTGRIGRTVIKNISGFGSKIIGYDLYQNDEIKDYMNYVDLETLYRESDIITLHAPYIEENHHLINRDTISKMKENVIIINTARGELIDTEALINGLEQGKIGAAGLDVLEGEVGIYHNDKRFESFVNHNMSILRCMPNVILTQHLAFYTDQAVYDMVECGLKSLYYFKNGEKNPWEILA